MTSSCPSFAPVSPITIYLVSQGLFHKHSSSCSHRWHQQGSSTQTSLWRHWSSEAVWSMCQVARKLGTASLRSCCLTCCGGYRSNVSAQSSRGNTFLTSAILSFLEAGFSLVSGGVCWDLEPVDSLSDSDWLSEDSELLFDSLPCSLSDWLAESEPEASSDAEWLMVEKEEVTFELHWHSCEIRANLRHIWATTGGLEKPECNCGPAGPSTPHWHSAAEAIPSQDWQWTWVRAQPKKSLSRISCSSRTKAVVVGEEKHEQCQRHRHYWEDLAVLEQGRVRYSGSCSIQRPSCYIKDKLFLQHSSPLHSVARGSK